MMAELPTPKEFNDSPLKYQSFQKFRIKSYLPQKGLIEASIGDTLSFEVEGTDAIKNLLVLDSLPSDTLYQDIQFLDKRPVYMPGLFSAQYIVASQTPQWLYVLYNDVIIMRYRLKLRGM